MEYLWGEGPQWVNFPRKFNYQALVSLKANPLKIEYGGKLYWLYHVTTSEDYDILIKRNKDLEELDRNVCSGSINGTSPPRRGMPFFANTFDYGDKYDQNKDYYIALDSTKSFIEYVSIVEKETEGNALIFRSKYVCSRFDPNVKGLGMFLRNMYVDNLYEKYRNDIKPVYFKLRAQNLKLTKLYCTKYNKYTVFSDGVEDIYIPLSKGAIDNVLPGYTKCSKFGRRKYRRKSKKRKRRSKSKKRRHKRRSNKRR